MARGLRLCFGLRTAVVTSLVRNEVGNQLEDLIFQGGVDQQFIQWRGKQILIVGGATSVDRTCVRFDEGHCWPEIESIAADVLTQVKKLMRKGGGMSY